MPNPYPHLYRIDGRPLPGLPRGVQREVTRACRVITRRTGYSAWFHAPSMTVQYHRGQYPKYGCAQDHVMTRGRYHPISIRDACQRIWRSRWSMDQKIAAFDKAERANATARDEKLHKHADDIGGSLVDEILHRIRKAQDPHSQRVFPLS